MISHPVLLDSNLTPKRDIIPYEQSLNLTAGLLSSGKLKVDYGTLNLRDIILIQTHLGKGYYRIQSLTEVNGIEQAVSFENTIVLLEDVVIPLGPVTTTTTTTGQNGAETTTTETTDTTISGTVTSILTQILAYQIPVSGVLPWTVGTVEATDSLEYVVDHQTIMEMLETLMEDLPDYWLDLNQDVYPWQINIKRKPTVPIAEGRLNRNIKSVKITYDEEDLCTRVYCSQLPSPGYIDSANLSTYGMAAVYLDFSADEITDAEALTRCQNYLAQRDKPTASIQMDLIDLYEITGESMDIIRPGAMFRITLPESGIVCNEIVTTLSYPNMINQPLLARVTLASSLKDASSGMAATAKRAQETAAQLVKVVRDQTLTLEDIRDVNNILYQAGLAIDAESGVWLFAKQTPEGAIGQAITSELRVQSNNISTAIGNISSLNGHTLAEVVGSSLYQNRDSITAAVGEMEVVTDSNTGQKTLVIKSGGGLSIQRNNVSFGVYDSGNLDAGIIIEKINGTGGSQVTISASKVDLGAYATVVNLNATNAEIGNLKSGVSSFTLVSAANVTASGQGTFGTLRVGGAVWASKSLTGIGAGTRTTFLGTSDVDLSHSHNITCSESGGVVTVEIGAATTSNTSSDSFNIADTAFFQNRVASAESMGVLEGKAAMGVAIDGSEGRVIASESSTKSVSIIATSDAPVLNSNHTYTFNARALAGSTTMDTTSRTTDDQAYWDGYYAGWMAAANGSGRNGNTVTYPSTTQDVFSSATATPTAISVSGYYYKGSDDDFYLYTGNLYSYYSLSWS